MKKGFFTLLITILIVGIANGQTYEERRKVIVSPGVSYQGQFFGEFNLMYSKLWGEHFGTFLIGPRLGIETNFNPTNFIYAPKIGYEISGLLFSTRANMVGYIENENLDLRLLPELGTSLLGLVNLNYGYNIPLKTFRATDVSKHRVTLTANVDIELWERLKK
ncbi:hypothetical protein [Sabulibacter ruber]|uniref:hypothetical protein n=1 Tax=Sabulibacter ruber TaxID=2811901 RepID=UPI001A95997F|nr:hypothetical protein [Sabulibacter ruber]